MKNILVVEKNVGQRLDKFLIREIFCNEEISRGDIIREIKAGKILVNQKSAKPSYALKAGDEIAVSSFLRYGGQNSNKLVPNKNLKIKTIFESANFVVVDKPAGIQVHPDAHEKENTLVNWLIAKYPKIKTVHDRSKEAELRPGIVHRLDKDTSGVMVAAKNQKTFDALKKLFQARKIKKTYLAIVEGGLEKKEGKIEKAIAKAANYKKQIIASGQTKTRVRKAMTEYKVKKKLDGYSLVEAHPRTGRTHQIRIHFWSIGHPVVGDKIYKAKSSKLKAKSLASRQLLHAEKLSFRLGGREYAFKSAMPKDMRDFLRLGVD